jgi:Eukaryotic translation initiation factor eIF2A
VDVLLQGTRFAILHGDGPKPNLSVYEMKDVRSAVKAVQPVVHNPSRAANVIHWSPTGKNMVLAGLKVHVTLLCMYLDYTASLMLCSSCALPAACVSTGGSTLLWLQLAGPVPAGRLPFSSSKRSPENPVCTPSRPPCWRCWVSERRQRCKPSDWTSMCASLLTLAAPTLQQMNGQLEFYNVEEAETMATGEHFMCTDIEWDPTGRYVATVVTSVHQMENGFNLWSWNGNLMYRWAAPSCNLWCVRMSAAPAAAVSPREAVKKAFSIGIVQWRHTTSDVRRQSLSQCTVPLLGIAKCVVVGLASLTLRFSHDTLLPPARFLPWAEA